MKNKQKTKNLSQLKLCTDKYLLLFQILIFNILHSEHHSNLGGKENEEETSK